MIRFIVFPLVQSEKIAMGLYYYRAIKQKKQSPKSAKKSLV